jgi:hypothetical protein
MSLRILVSCARNTSSSTLPLTLLLLCFSLALRGCIDGKAATATGAELIVIAWGKGE